ncbi:hypothetical protein GXW82_11320 [Streptacidiphilus sp. 4-A2]|nr:hypothetical protein [Streptacidiphilus sp. 4-A2]
MRTTMLATVGIFAASVIATMVAALLPSSTVSAADGTPTPVPAATSTPSDLGWG